MTTPEDVTLETVQEGLIRVAVDGVVVSEHQREDKAISSAYAASALNPQADVRIVRPDLRVDGKVTCAATKEEPIPEDDPVDDPSSGDPSMGTPVFADDFSSGDLSHREGGWGWGSGKGSVVEGAGRSGSNALVITFPGEPDNEDSWEFHNLHVMDGSGVPEIWVEYWMRVPPNYLHRHQAGPGNNKFFGLWRHQARDDDHRFIPNLARTDINVDDGDRLSSFIFHDNTPDRRWRVMADPFIRAEDHGRWIRVRFHVAVADIGQDAGVIEMWKDAELLYSADDLPLMYTETGDPALNVYSHIRLLGWSNSGYDEDTEFAFDGIAIYDSDPGW